MLVSIANDEGAVRSTDVSSPVTLSFVDPPETEDTQMKTQDKLSQRGTNYLCSG